MFVNICSVIFCIVLSLFVIYLLFLGGSEEREKAITGMGKVTLCDYHF